MSLSSAYLFVYGSLRSGFKSPAYEYISRYFNHVCDARVKGDLYDMGEFPAAVPTQDERFIVGELYRIKDEREFAWAFGQLDDYEGVYSEEGEPPLYRRELAHVYCSQNVTAAWIYWFNKDVSGRPRVESGDMLQYLRDKK